MDTTPTTRFDEQGTVLKLRAAVPFALHDSEKIWLLMEGKLDLFLVEVRDGEPVGTRHHLTTIEAGIAMVGFNPLPASALGVIAIPVSESQALCLDRTQFQDWARTSPVTVAPLIDRWIESLGAAANPNPTPTDFRKMTAGEEIEVEDHSLAILPTTGAMWIRPLKGSFIPLGDGQMSPIMAKRFFPVTRAVWMRCAPHSRVLCLSTTEWFETDEKWAGLRLFQDQMFSRLVELRRQEDEIEKARLHAVEEADAYFFENALYKLAEPLQAGEERVLETGGTLEPLLQVCRIVFKASGIEAPQFPHGQSLTKQPDPVNAIALASRIRTRQVMLKGKWWKLESVPMVGFYDNKRPIALLPSRRGYQVYDPATGERHDVDEELASKLHGFASVFYRPFPHKALGIFDILTFGLRSSGRDAVTIFVMGLAAGLLSMVAPVFTGIIFDTIIPGAERSTLGAFSLFLVITALAMALFSLTRSLATLRLESRMEASVQAAVWDRLLGLPVPFFRQFTSGDLARRSLGISKIREMLTGSALTSILTGIFSVTSCALMFYYSWPLALVATVLVFVSLLVSTLCGFFQVRILRGVSQLSGRISGMTLQFINGIPKFRVAGTEARAFSVWASEFAKQRTLSMRASKISNLSTVFDSVFPVLASGVIFYFGVNLMKTPDKLALTTGEFLAFLAAFVQFSTGALDLSSVLISVLNVVPLYERAKPILKTLPEVSSARKEPRPLIGGIELHQISFRYRDEGPLVLRDLSLAVRPGEFIAIVGPSGSGKSTLFRLLLGFETPSAGAIFYDGQDLAELDVQSVRRQIGVVLQNAKLMQGSIFRNIVGEGTLSIDDAWEAARHAGLEEDLKGMPMGMHTVISESGGGLSGGQRQRLLVARAIVRKPRILLFDEATSALDNRTQAIVSQSLKDLNATRVIIAHRLSTVMQADRIFVLDRGNLGETGTYEELMAHGGLFSQLAKRQLS
ncbi:MAG TPA: NHLP bacteriocin export ABC transporter permease/ATPase subunit [Terriglobales bacterium]|nr:NHLP bacteriocin export ABC transporter permease/ATPase subunit [Terriglobales bacterium]